MMFLKSCKELVDVSYCFLSRKELVDVSEEGDRNMSYIFFEKYCI